MLSNSVVSGEYIYTGCEYSPRANIYTIHKVTEEDERYMESNDEIALSKKKSASIYITDFITDANWKQNYKLQNVSRRDKLP